MRKIIRLTESDLHRVIKESVKHVLNQKKAEMDSDWNELDKQRIDPYGGDFDLVGKENNNVHDYHGAFGKMALSNDSLDRSVGQDANIWKSIKEAARYAIGKHLKEAYVGSLRKKIYGEDPDNRSSLDIYQDGNMKTYISRNGQGGQSVTNALNETFNVMNDNDVVPQRVAEKFGFKLQFKGKKYDAWVNMNMTLRDLKASKIKPMEYTPNGDGTFTVRIVVKPEETTFGNIGNNYAKFRKTK